MTSILRQDFWLQLNAMIKLHLTSVMEDGNTLTMDGRTIKCFRFNAITHDPTVQIEQI